MTVVRLPDGGLWVHSPVPLSEPLRAELAALGPIRWIVAPNLFHHLYAGDWAKAYPEASLLAVAGLAKKRPDLPPATILDTSRPWGDTLEPLPILGQPLFNETAFFHHPSRTIISCDLAANLPPTDHLWTRFYSWMTGLHAKPSVNLVLRSGVKDKGATRRSVDTVLAHAPERLIVSHGLVVETEATPALREAWSWLAG